MSTHPNPQPINNLMHGHSCNNENKERERERPRSLKLAATMNFMNCKKWYKFMLLLSPSSLSLNSSRTTSSFIDLSSMNVYRVWWILIEEEEEQINFQSEKKEKKPLTKNWIDLNEKVTAIVRACELSICSCVCVFSVNNILFIYLFHFFYCTSFVVRVRRLR